MDFDDRISFVIQTEKKLVISSVKTSVIFKETLKQGGKISMNERRQDNEENGNA